MRSSIIKLLVLFVATSDISHSTILRLPCKTFADFSVIRKDTSLEKDYASFNGISADECKGRCIFDTRCKSVNIKEDDLICKLNDKSTEDKKDNVTAIRKPGWTYYSTSYNDTLIGQNCKSFKPCPAGKRCTDTCICPGYNCSDIDNCAGNPCKNGGSCQSKDQGFSCTCTGNYDGPTCEEVKKSWIKNCKMPYRVSHGPVSQNSCYAACKDKNLIAATYRTSTNYCYCALSPDSQVDSDYQCIFFPPATKIWENDCSYESAPMSPLAKDKWHCYYICKGDNYIAANWVQSSLMCNCNYGEKREPYSGGSCIKIRS